MATKRKSKIKLSNYRIIVWKENRYWKKGGRKTFYFDTEAQFWKKYEQVKKVQKRLSLRAIGERRFGNTWGAKAAL